MPILTNRAEGGCMAVKNEEYQRTQLTITAFDAEDSIVTSGAVPDTYKQDLYETRGIPDTAW